MSTPDPADSIPLAPTLSERVMTREEYNAADPEPADEDAVDDAVDELRRDTPPVRDPWAPTAQDQRTRRERIKGGYTPNTSNVVGPRGVAQSKSEARREADAAVAVWRANGGTIPREPEHMPRIEYVPDELPENKARQPGPTGERAQALAIARLELPLDVDPLDTAAPVLPDPWGAFKPPHWWPDAMAFVLDDFVLPVRGKPRYKKQRPPVHNMTASDFARDPASFNGTAIEDDKGHVWIDRETVAAMQSHMRANLCAVAPIRPAEDCVRKATPGYSFRQCEPIHSFYGCRKTAKGWKFRDKTGAYVPDTDERLGTRGIMVVSNKAERGEPAVLPPVLLLAA